MPTTVSVTFILGRYHATPWATHVNEGQVELPPSPWRILRALYAVWKERRPDLDETTVHDLLHRLAEPPQFDVPDHILAHTRHYYPDLTSTSSKKSSDQIIDTFAALDPRQPLLITWPFDLPPQQRHVLEALCKALPYLGRSESLCTAELLSESASPAPGSQQWTPTTVDDDRDRNTPPRKLLTPDQPLDLAALTARPIDWRRTGLLYPRGTHHTLYRQVQATAHPPEADSPPNIQPEPARKQNTTTTEEPVVMPEARSPSDFLSSSATRANPAHTVVRLDLAQPSRLAYRDTALVTRMLHAAAASKLPDHHTRKSLSNLLGIDDTGRNLRSNHRHAHLLAAPDSHRRITRLIVWSPDGLADDEIDALCRISELRNRHISRLRQPTRILVTAIGGNELLPPEWTGASRHWESVTPYLPTGHPKKDLARYVHHRIPTDLNYTQPGLSDLLDDIHILDRPPRTSTGGIFAREQSPPHRTISTGNFYVRIRFKKHHTPHRGGLLTAGQLSHYGLGLFRPLPPHELNP
ncbi:type I-U CRISPR-associated protein Cas5/Cas6 [Kineosporia sp. J2-2]|uniref:Type I-U CRISPR-associated protein Cas5/Cas6 n=1 Tax=Kineosporia corallincola TaxID=2835133 RepID=A0ABS5TTT6_9ACTN|nr:type I-U CRISPR-associated protein Csb2 [Kineosporia corallincola]MBT0774222.1 type I-U CRISPR-associated protein Cas5/Cas6 [Kineosporia corallincola]